MKIIWSTFAATIALAGCATAPERVVVSAAPAATVSTPQPVARQTAARTESPMSSANAMLKPGPSYVASFPEADRRAACDRLNYQVGTQAYSNCLIGDFPENPYFTASAN